MRRRHPPSDEALANPSSDKIDRTTHCLISPIGPLSGVVTETHFGVAVNGSDDRMRMGRLLTFLATLGGAANGLGVNANTAVAVECEGADNGMAQVFGTFAYFLSTEVADLNVLAANKPLDFREIRVRRIDGGTMFNFQAAWTADGDFGDLYYIDAVGGLLIPHPFYGTIY